LLVLQGEKDKLVVPAGAKMIVDKASSNDKQYKEYPDALHHLLVELDDVKTDVQKTIFDWIARRL
jgi:alpha-beta hydrolase superfamily lysophospholipase